MGTKQNVSVFCLGLSVFILWAATHTADNPSTHKDNCQKQNEKGAIYAKAKH